MKNITIRLLLLATIVICSQGVTWAQEPNDDYDPNVEFNPDLSFMQEFQVKSPTPKIKSTSIIQYSDGISLAVEFPTDALTPQVLTLQNKSNSSDVRNLSISAGNALTFTTSLNQTYDIRVLNAEGQLETIGTVSTTPYRAGDAVAVSEELYRALSQYVTSETQATQLPAYIQGLPNVSTHEKTSFVQRYVMNGAVLPANVKGTFPTQLTKDAIRQRGEKEECICNFVMNQVTVVNPDQTGNGDFSIGEKIESSFYFYNPKSFRYRGAKMQGPAKSLRLHSDGKAAGSTRRTETWEMGGDGLSDNYVRIGYHLMCIGITELPKACDCDKQVKYDFGYYSKVEATTSVSGPCILPKDAYARAQDWAVVIATREKINNVSDVQVLASGIASAESKCSGGVPVSVLVDAAKVGVSVFKIVKSVKTGNIGNLQSDINDVIDKVGSVLEKFTQVKDCSNALVDKPLAAGTATFTFKPNDPLSFIVLSGSSMEVRGLRCWSSIANINSSFHLAGVVQGGSPNALTTHCCTNYFANWAYASQRNDAQNRQNSINGHLALNNPGGWQTVNGNPNPGPGFLIPSQVGYSIGVNLPSGQTCKKEIPIFNNPR